MEFQRNNVASMQTGAAVYDEGLRAFMLQVYNYMASALALTGIVAWFAAQSPAVIAALYNVNPQGQIAGLTGLGWVVALAPLAPVILLAAKVQTLSLRAVQATFWGYSALVGLSLTSLLLMYTGESIARVFFITALTFGAMSLYGYTTKRDLTGMGSFLFMGLIGLIIGSVVNIFMQSPAVYYALSFIGVLVFTGLTAYDTQMIKNSYDRMAGSGEAMAKAAIMGALSLYMDFINLFIMLLRFFGDRR